MSERRCISAYTATGGGYYPPYFNATRQPDGSVTVTVRGDPDIGPAASDPTVDRYYEGRTAFMTVPADVWRLMVADFVGETVVSCDCAIKQAQAEVGKPHGGPLA